jgi:hypothetical protein
MYTEPGPNEPCWCGSGFKYKKCHRGREQEILPTKHELHQIVKDHYDQKYCMHPQASSQTCRGGIVKAHTIQRAGGLTRIARNGQVYSFRTDAIRLEKTGGMNEARLVGINQASTFTGFCALHDNQIFAPIEKNPFKECEEHAFLLAYRALCKELFLKKATIELVSAYKRILDKGKPRSEQENIQGFLSDYETGLRAGLRELEHYKSAYDIALINSDYSSVQYYIVQIDSIPEFMCSAPLQPDFDFKGHRLQSLANVSSILDHITFSLIATDNGGAIVFSWLGQSNAGKMLVSTLDSLSDVELPHAILRFAFEYFENLYVSPVWWDNLDNSATQALLTRQMTGAMPDSWHTPFSLRDDDLRLISWAISSRATNIT